MNCATCEVVSIYTYAVCSIVMLDNNNVSVQWYSCQCISHIHTVLNASATKQRSSPWLACDYEYGQSPKAETGGPWERMLVQVSQWERDTEQKDVIRECMYIMCVRKCIFSKLPRGCARIDKLLVLLPYFRVCCGNRENTCPMFAAVCRDRYTVRWIQNKFAR